MGWGGGFLVFKDVFLPFLSLFDLDVSPFHYITQTAKEKEVDRYCLPWLESLHRPLLYVYLFLLTCIESDVKAQDRGRSITIIKQNKNNGNCGPEREKSV